MTPKYRCQKTVKTLFATNANISTLLIVYFTPVWNPKMLWKIPVVWKKDWREIFVMDGQPLNFALVDFRWWWFSNLVTNNLRWILAEYIVATAVWADHTPREERDAYDVITPEGINIEVKSASYIQSREQRTFSVPSFSIRPTQWRDDVVWRQWEKKRQADVYVFCLLAHKDQATINPLDLSQRVFYIIPTQILNEQCKSQKTLSLSRLQKMWFTPVQYPKIADTINNTTK